MIILQVALIVAMVDNSIHSGFHRGSHIGEHGDRKYKPSIGTSYIERDWSTKHIKSNYVHEFINILMVQHNHSNFLLQLDKYFPTLVLMIHIILNSLSLYYYPVAFMFLIFHLVFLFMKTY